MAKTLATTEGIYAAMAIKLALAADFEELGIPFCYTCGDTLMEEYTADHKRNIFDVYQ